MANTQRGNRRFRKRGDPSWYDRSMADNVSARQPDVAIDIPEDKVGLIIGKKGLRLQEIKEKSRAHVVVVDNKVQLTGTPEQCEKAKKIISEILNSPAALMANSQRGNRRSRNRDDPSWYDKSLADNVSARQPDLTIDIPEDKVGLIIGKKGLRLQEIKEQSRAHVVVVDNKVQLTGTPEQCEKAKKIIGEILNPSAHYEHYLKRLGFKLVQNLHIPKELIGLVIGTKRENFYTIETTTGVSLQVHKDELYMKAESEESEKLAVRKIKEYACEGVQRTAKFVYVDSAQLKEKHEIQLAPAQLVSSDARLGETYYKLQLLEDPLQEETFPGFRTSDGLEEKIFKVLENINAEKDDQEVKVDMWCHFGHAYITKVDEEEVGDPFTLNEVKEKFQNENGKTWKPFFKGGVEEMEVEAITSLPSRATQEDIRYDFAFYTPSCRSVRVKAWIMKENSGQEGGDAGSGMVFCTTAPTTVRNILTIVKSNENGAASNTPSFHLCYRSHHRMKVDILMPAKGLDCRLSIRTWKNDVPKTPQDEEEDKILKSYLMGMKIDGDRLILPPASQLQKGFELHYHRRSLRKIYQYEMEGEQFSLKVCKDQATNVDPCDFDRIKFDEIPVKIDVHLHCDEWDRALDEGNWEPQQIAAKVSNFLEFLRNVQQNVSPKAIRGD